MLIAKNVRLWILISAASLFLVTGLMPFEAIAFTKTQCTGCGCTYARICDVDSCWISCSCKMGPQSDCIDKKFSAVIGGARISKSPSRTIYKFPASPPAKK
jgi:hypothetical protein